MELEAGVFRKLDEDGNPESDEQTEIEKDENKKNTGGVITGQEQIKRGGLIDGPTPPKTGINNPHHHNNDTWCCWTCCYYNNPSSSPGTTGCCSGPQGCGTCGGCGCDGDGDGDCCECDGCCDCDCDCGDCDCGGCDCGSVDCGSC